MEARVGPKLLARDAALAPRVFGQPQPPTRLVWALPPEELSSRRGRQDELYAPQPVCWEWELAAEVLHEAEWEDARACAAADRRAPVQQPAGQPSDASAP